MAKDNEKLDKLVLLVEALVKKEVAPIAPIAPVLPVAPVLPIAQPDHAFNASNRYIDLSRVPLICQSIIGIHDSLKEIKEKMVNTDQYAAIKNELAALSDNQKWLVRSILGVVVAGVIGYFFLNR